METIYDMPDKVKKRFTVADGYNTSYFEAGDDRNSTVVLIHGANWDFGLGAERWYPTIVPLSRSFHIVAPDQLGGGDTDAPRNLAEIGHIRVRADHLIAFIETLGRGSVALVGQSQGAWISAYIALTRPDLVNRLVLVDTASLSVERGGIDDPDIATRFSEGYVPGTMVNRRIYVEGDLERGVKEAVESMVYDPSKLPKGYLDACYRLAEKWVDIWRDPWMEFWNDSGRRNSKQYLINGVHPVEMVHNLHTPPLIIWGKNSVKGIQKGIELFKRIPDAQLHLLDKADHFVWQDQPEIFNELVTWFLLSSSTRRSESAQV